MNNYGDGISQQLLTAAPSDVIAQGFGQHAPTDAASSRISYSRAENQEKEDQEEQQVNAALEDAGFAARKGDDANGQCE
jgi:hypothetical protein